MTNSLQALSGPVLVTGSRNSMCGKRALESAGQQVDKILEEGAHIGRFDAVGWPHLNVRKQGVILCQREAHNITAAASQ